MLLSTDKVDVLGTLFSIILLDKMIELDDQDGRLDYNKKIIYCDSGHDPDKRAETIVHEIVHAYALKMDEWDAVTEKQILAMGSLIYQFIAHNADLVIDLAKLVKIARGED